MKKLLIFICICLSTILCNSQSYSSRPSNPDPKISLFVGPHVELSFIEHFEYGLIGGVNMKDIVMVGGFYQRSIYNNNFYGLYTQVNINPKNYYFHIGYSLKAGLVNNQYISLEPAMTMQHTSLNNKFKFCHSVGFSGGLPTYTFSVWFGKFGEKWWKNPLKEDMRKIKMSRLAIPK